MSRWGSWAVVSEAAWVVAALASFGATLFFLSGSNTVLGAILSLAPPVLVRTARAVAVASRHSPGTEIVAFLYSSLLLFAFALATLAAMFYAVMAADPLDQPGPSPRRAWVAMSVGPPLFLLLYFSFWPRSTHPPRLPIRDASP